VPVAHHPPETAPYHLCGRCRQAFPLDSGADPRSAADWWACEPCRAKLLPNTATL
jgi:hypothetical protein